MASCWQYEPLGLSTCWWAQPVVGNMTVPRLGAQGDSVVGQCNTKTTAPDPATAVCCCCWCCLLAAWTELTAVKLKEARERKGGTKVRWTLAYLLP